MSLEVMKTTFEGVVHTTVIVVSPSSQQMFQELVQRATNLWPDAPPEIKEFADVITNGHVLQNYWSQDTSSKN
jgi:hypothetical protein